MAEIRSGASWTSLTALLIGIGLIGFLAYSATKKTDDIENYGKDSSHIEITEHNYPLALPRCGQLIGPIGQTTGIPGKKAVK